MTASCQENRERKKTILLVDDESSTLELVREALECKEYAIISATDGISGWEKFKKSKPDLVVTDIMMPRRSGIEFLRLIRQKNLSTPVIIVTGYGNFENALEALKLGADDFIEKPFNIGELIVSVRSALRKGSLERENCRYREIASLLAKENRTQEIRIARLTEGLTHKKIKKYRAICGLVAHSMKGEFLHIGHSIKELRELAGTSREIQEECDMIERSVGYSHILLRRLLDHLDIGSAMQKPIDVLEVFRRVELLARPRLPSSINLHIIIDQSIKERVVYANTEQLMGVLLELIDNAVNVLRKKGGTIELILEGRNGEIGISVKDNGPGIPAKLRKELFKKQVSSKSGLGIGLFLCNKVISELEGKLNLQTASGEGTTFTILLPSVSDKKRS